MFIVSPDLNEEAAEDTLKRVQTYITSHGGEIQTFEIWGRRRLAYSIKHQREGVYHLAHFSLGAEHARDFDQTLKRNEQILRHLIVRVD